ncbi:hypothetical protein LCGC14_2715050, partial [marine sediment metagenome]
MAVVKRLRDYHGRYRASQSAEERFWSKVARQANGCWEWRGGTSRGYGVFWLNGRLVKAHVYAYERDCGTYPKHLELDHWCRNPSCVNPFHLEPVTHRENMLRGQGPIAMRAKQTHCKRGHPFDASNTLIRKNGTRRCRICVRAEGRRYYFRKEAGLE